LQPANDPVIPQEVVEELTAITDETPETMERLAEAYGMTLVEASAILFREYGKREKHCFNEHGIARSDLRMRRVLAQRGLVDQHFGAYFKSVDSRFADWYRRRQESNPVYEATAAATKAAFARPESDRTPWVKGEAKYRRKKFLRDRAAARAPNPHGFAAIQSIHKHLWTDGPGVTSSGQLAAVGAWAFEVYNKGRKLLGMKPALRGAAKIAGYLAERSAERVGKNETAEKVYTDMESGKKLSAAEVVRRYHRAGIGH
jgi:hypothetical protein